jgi:hypothetical protein
MTAEQERFVRKSLRGLYDHLNNMQSSGLDSISASKEAFIKEVLELYVRRDNDRAEKIFRDGKAAPL